jgi:hypothetical protein
MRFSIYLPNKQSIMKKILIFTLLAITTLTVNAQRRKSRASTSQGNWAVRLGGGYNSNTIDPTGDQLSKITNFDINPSVGYMIVDNFELGLSFNVGSKTTDVVSVNNPLNKYVSTDKTNGIGAYAQKYFPMNNWFAFYANLNAGATFGNFARTDFSGTGSTNPLNDNGSINGYNGGVTFGFGFTPINNFMLSADIAKLGLNAETRDPNGPNNSINTSNLNFNTLRNSVNINLVWFFGRDMWVNN